MDDEERKTNWEIITQYAKKIIFIRGICKIQYRFGENIIHETRFLEDDYSILHLLILY